MFSINLYKYNEIQPKSICFYFTVMCYNFKTMCRKRICLLTIYPEGEYQQRIMPGIFSQCAKYDYDVVVVSPLVQVCSSQQDYLEGELKIYDLVNFDLFDGVIITPIPMTEDQTYSLIEVLLKKIQKECKVPVVSVDMEFGDYPVVYTDDENAFFHITEHLITVHNCKNFSVLGGLPEVTLCNSRVNGIKKSLEKHGLQLNENQVYSGDFWYTSGEILGNRYITKELELPDAVICLSDHMAIGLTNYLIKHGINVPEQVIVTGYEAVREASMNTPPITSYAADQAKTGSLAVNYLHKMIDTGEVAFPVFEAGVNNLCIGRTCGCVEDYKYTHERLSGTQINTQYDYRDTSPDRRVTMGMLLESYMSERLAGTNTPFDCLSEIYQTKYLIKPFNRLYLCMNDDWLKKDYIGKKVYSQKIDLTMFSNVDSAVHGVKNHVFLNGEGDHKFNVKEMLPSLYENYSEPQVFYFVPVHFTRTTLGYFVVQNNLSTPRVLGSVFRNYMRNVNTALEMIRAKYQIAYLSEHDSMTEIYNRRGMEHMVSEMLKTASSSDVWFVIVIDMDGLKIRNDTYGHSEGDNGIIAISQASLAITGENEICVRGGGDEFFVMGLGNYNDSMLQEKIKIFNNNIEKINSELAIPVSASIGYALGNNTDCSYQSVMEMADKNMYNNKQEKKKNQAK